MSRLEGMVMNEVELAGCKLEPLMNYLKAVGILRIVSLQKDRSAAGYWHGNRFVIRSRLDEPSLFRFFLEEYEPSPILTPWNKSSGFYPRGEGKKKKDVKVINALRDHASPRLDRVKKAIRAVDAAIKEVMGTEPENVTDKKIENCKEELMAFCRNNLSDELLDWIDAVYVLSIGERFNYEPNYAILMGSGGNDGRLEFAVNYLNSVLDVFEWMEGDGDEARDALEESLFEKGKHPAAEKEAMGFFHPGGVGGPNAAEGFEGGFLSNPWDFIFMVEGVLLFAGSVSRRLSCENLPRSASFPFSVAPVIAGPRSLSDGEGTGNSSRGELWLPIWDRPVGIRELRRLFSEGRANVGRRSARDGLDFARAVATLGVSRGIRGFIRYGLYQRSGNAYLAIPLNILPAKEERLKGADLLSDIDVWLGRIKGLASDENVPIKARGIPRQVYNSIFDYLVKGDTASFQRLLVSLGKAEMILSDLVYHGNKRAVPTVNLSPAWADIADDGSPEFRIARALAGIGWTGADLTPIRMDVQSVEIRTGKMGNKFAVRSEEKRKTVPLVNDPLRYFALIFERRCLLGKEENRDLVPVGSMCHALIKDVSKFLRGFLDERRILDLFTGLILVNGIKPSKVTGSSRVSTKGKAYSLSRDYVLIKACHLPEPLTLGGEKIVVPYGLQIGKLLMARRLRDACSEARRKLMAKGIPTVDCFGKDDVDPLRLYVSLLIPVETRAFAARALPLIVKEKNL